jgi:hypothetical protein
MRQVHSSPALRPAIILLGVTQVLSSFPAAKCRLATLARRVITNEQASHTTR